jgi:hypothetical protein
MRLFIASAAIATTVAVISALCGQVVTASVAKQPVIYNYAEGWHHGRVKPAKVFVGADAPYMTGLIWSHWTRTAYARGILHQQSSACLHHHPSYQCPFIKYTASVSLWHVKTHHKQPYFSKMTWKYLTRSGRKRAESWRVTRRGFFDPS